MSGDIPIVDFRVYLRGDMFVIRSPQHPDLHVVSDTLLNALDELPKAVARIADHQETNHEA